MKILCLGLISALLLICSSLFSQEIVPAPSNELDMQFAPGKNSIFNTNSSAAKESKGEDQEVDISNSIKINIGLFMRNSAVFFWERKLGSTVTVQPGLGITFNKDNILSLMGEDMNISQKTSVVSYTQLIRQGSFRGPRAFASLALRFYSNSMYYDNDVFKSGYFEMNVRYTSMNLLIYESSSSSSGNYSYQIRGNPTVNLGILSYYTIFGYQFCTSGSVKTTHDFYLGGGLRSVRYDVFESDPMNNNSNTYYAIRAYKREAVWIPSFVFGYALGFGF